MLDCIELNPANQTADAAVILLHGLGASNQDLVPLVNYWPQSLRKHTRFIFPNAPQRPITINGGMTMPAWYDIAHMDFTQREDAAGIDQSQAQISAVIDQEFGRGIAHDKIILGGFSQGGAMSLYTGLRQPQALAGILALSCYLPLAARLDEQAHASQQRTPIWMAHGQHDPVVPLALAQDSHQQLSQAGYAVDWQSYAMGHEICPPQIQVIGQWLAGLLD